MLYLKVMIDIQALKNLISPKKQLTKEYFLDLLDGEKQISYENEHVQAVMQCLKALYINRLKLKISAAEDERQRLMHEYDYTAEKYRRVLELGAEISAARAKMQEYKPFFDEPYFARMDLTDDKEGYNSYYIGKHGDEGLEIVDWRAPLAQKYYQKSRTFFSINDYNYKLILRRAIRTKSGKVLDIKNEYLSLSDYLTPEEIGGRDEALVFDPFLKEILSNRKESREICDIIETIQEKQFEIITLPEGDEFVLQGVAGSGKTMILLHRLSYIMYNNERLRPTDVLVITPSDSFNAFIDELSQVLELEKVKTSTLVDYYLNMLKSVGADFTGKIDMNAPAPEEYLKYIYSQKFSDDLESKLAKIFDGVYGLFTAEECKDTAREVSAACAGQIEHYEKIKNASLRVRRCVLGEIKEKQGGGLYYTKQFRYLFNCVLDVREFLELAFDGGKMKNYAYFYKQLLSFYKSVKFIRRYGKRICAAAMQDLKNLSAAVDKEIADLKRYKMKLGDREVLTYATGIEKREQLKDEIDAVICRVEAIDGAFLRVDDFADVLRGDRWIVTIGKCENTLDVLRFFYRETIKKAKLRYGVQTKPLIKSDAFALCSLCCKLGLNLSPKYSYMFIDEGQDVSAAEYAVLKAVNERAVFNIFGDLKQNVTPFRGICDWDELGFKKYELTLNYRNTNQIVEYVAKNLGVNMLSIGFDGEEVGRIALKSATSWLSGKSGLKAIICSEERLEELSKKAYNVLRASGRISKSKINLMTVYESKGLEFTAVVVAEKGMSVNERYIACTRALKNLALTGD